MMPLHEHYTRSSKKMSFEDALAKLQSELSNQISKVTSEVRATKEEVLDLKDVIIKRLQEENNLLRTRCSKLENKVISLESSINHVEQYGRRNNIVISGIPDDIIDDDLENTVSKIMKDVDVQIESKDIEACHRIGKTDQRTGSKKTIVRFVNRKYCKKALLNRKNFRLIDTEAKYNFSRNNKIFINENLTKANETIAYCGRKLKRANLIHSCYVREGVVYIKNTEHSKPTKAHHINILYDHFPEFVFFDDNEERDVFVDASPNVSGQSSY